MGAQRGIGVGRVVVIAGFSLSCFALLLFLWLSFGGPIPLKSKGYQYEAALPEGSQVADQADVRVAGVTIGHVVDQRLDPAGNRNIATIEIDSRYAPIRSDARAILRQKTLLGEAYLEMTLGSRTAPPVPDGGRLANARIENAVELDELLKIFDKDTRDAFRAWQSELAKASAGRGRELNEAFGSFGGFVQDGADVLEILDRRGTQLRGLVRDTGTTFEALTRSSTDLRAFIAETAEVFDATASQREALARSIELFPPFLDESRLTLARLEGFSRLAEPLLRDLEPALRDAIPALRDIGRLAPDLRRLFVELDPLITASRRGFPAMAAFLDGLRPVLGELGPFLRELNPILRWLELNQQNVGDFISNGANATAGIRADSSAESNGHVLPQIITTGSQSLITPQRSPDNRGNSYPLAGRLADPRLKDQLVLPSFDCRHEGGEKPRNTAPPPLGEPACYVAGLFDFFGRREFFPRITRGAAR